MNLKSFLKLLTKKSSVKTSVKTKYVDNSGFFLRKISKLLKLFGKNLNPSEIRTLLDPRWHILNRNYKKFEKKYKDDINRIRKKYNLPEM